MIQAWYVVRWWVGVKVHRGVVVGVGRRASGVGLRAVLVGWQAAGFGGGL